MEEVACSRGYVMAELRGPERADRNCGSEGSAELGDGIELESNERRPAVVDENKCTHAGRVMVGVRRTRPQTSIPLPQQHTM